MAANDSALRGSAAAMGTIAASAAMGGTMGAVAIPASPTAMGGAAASVFPPAGAHTAATCRTAVHTGQFTAAMPAATDSNGTGTNTTCNVGPTGSGGPTTSAVHPET